MNKDREILREVVKIYRELATREIFQEKYNLHKATNDLKPIRPSILIEEIPWGQMDFDGSLMPQCENKQFANIEMKLRRDIYKMKYMPTDNMYPDYIEISKSIGLSGFGMNIKEETKQSDATAGIVSHKYESQFNCEEDLDQIILPTITYNEENTKNRMEVLGNTIGDLIDLRLVGRGSGYDIGYKVWDIISSYMTVDDLLINLMDEPEFMHKLVQKLSEVFTYTIDKLEEIDGLEQNNLYCHCSANPCSDLEKAKEGEKVTAKNMWGRGLAQILATVSPSMHDEFEIEYAEKALKRFGLVYYGCCEPLDKKMHVVKKIKNLRKVSITPWADINIAAEAIGRDYVISAKPNPAALSTKVLNEKEVEREITNIINACQKNNTPVEILLKDISTVANDPKSLFKWAEIATSLVK